MFENNSSRSRSSRFASHVFVAGHMTEYFRSDTGKWEIFPFRCFVGWRILLWTCVIDVNVTSFQ